MIAAALGAPVLKICGVTTPGDARAVASLGVELVGLNFYPRSPRYLELERALEVRRALGDRALVAGVFVDAPPERVAEIDCPLCMPFLTNMSVYVCRRPRWPLAQMWPDMKMYL